MAEFLTTKGVAFYLENIIFNGSKKLVLVSPSVFEYPGVTVTDNDMPGNEVDE